MEQTYKGVQITKNEKSGNYYLKSPVNGTQRIFKTIERALYYIDYCEALDSHATAMGRLAK